MQPDKLVRNSKRVLEALTELPNGSVIANETVKIYVPNRFLEKGLAYVGVDTYILGIYAIVLEDKYYGVSLVNAMIPIDPSQTNRLKWQDEVYLEFIFNKGATVFKSTDLVKTDVLTYRIYDEILSNGNIPWYVGYEELGHLFDTAQYHAGANIGANQEVTQLIASIVARDSKDRTKFYRSTITETSDLVNHPPVFIPLKSVEYAATNTVNKLGGSYMSVGIVSALINPTERVERIEHLLRV
jgi:hypothetical protein